MSDTVHTCKCWNSGCVEVVLAYSVCLIIINTMIEERMDIAKFHKCDSSTLLPK